MPCVAQLFPGVTVITTGDLRSDASWRFWSASAIWRRIDLEGYPIIVSGWPCDGDSAQNAKAANTEGPAHPSTSTLMHISRIRRAVVAHMGTPRVESTPERMTFARALRVP